MKHLTVQVDQEFDETGALEELSWDLFPIVRSPDTMHLQDNGVPKVGVQIKPGMIIVGKIGKTKYFDAARQPNDLEIHGLPFEELRNRFGRMWQDRSLYATPEICGTVISARVEKIDGKFRAIVELKPDDS